MNTPSLLRLSALTVCGFLFVKTAQAQPPPPPGKQWVVVTDLTDEFDSWNSAKWWKPLWNYGVPVQMVAGNSGVSNGKLWIKATLDNGSTRWFQTSRVMSQAQTRFPMYTECSMRTAHISAYNTFWLNNGDSNNRDEIDICENNSNPSITSQTDRPYTMYSQYFIVVNGNVERAAGDFDNRDLSPQNPLRGVKWNEAYHTLGAWWQDKNNVQFYLDGEPAGSVVTARDFTRDQNIIWDLWTINASWSGGIANQADLLDDNINTMYVDWIHTYELVDVTVTGAPMFAWTQVFGGDMVMQVTNGTPSGIFNLLYSSDMLTPVGNWATNQAELQFDSVGAATVTNPISGGQAYFLVQECFGCTSTPPTMATFDWEEVTVGSSWWLGDDYTETENGITLVASGRAFSIDTSGNGRAIKANYAVDANPGFFVMQVGGVDQPFVVTSIDISGNGNVPNAPSVSGKLGGVQQWEILPPTDSVFYIYTTATSGDLSLEIDEIVWNGPWEDPGATVWGNEIDNLIVSVELP